MNKAEKKEQLKKTIGAYLFFYWCIGAIFFFVGMGLPVWEDDPLTGAFILTVVIGILDVIFIQLVNNEFFDKKVKPMKLKANGKIKYDYFRLLRSVLFSALVMTLVMLVYWLINLVQHFPIESFGFAFFFTGIYILIKQIAKKIGD